MLLRVPRCSADASARPNSMWSARRTRGQHTQACASRPPSSWRGKYFVSEAPSVPRTPKWEKWREQSPAHRECGRQLPFPDPKSKGIKKFARVAADRNLIGASTENLQAPGKGGPVNKLQVPGNGWEVAGLASASHQRALHRRQENTEQ